MPARKVGRISEVRGEEIGIAHGPEDPPVASGRPCTKAGGEHGTILGAVIGVRSYVRVVVVWLLVLAALFLFQEYFG